MINKTTTTINLKNIRLSLKLGSWVFEPGLIPTLVVVLLLPLLLFLGCWQWHRAEAKQQLLDQFAARSQQAPQPLADYEPIYTRVQVTGHFDNQHLILLDNRIVNHQPGYDVLAPFIPEGGQGAVLVNLGWAPLSQAKKIVESAPVGNSRVTITGLAQPPEHNLVLAHPEADLSWPLLVEEIRLNVLSSLLNRPLHPFILLLSSTGGLVPHWGIVTSVTPARHRGYAVQWFALALALMILYLKLNIRRNRYE
jgi:surfeit locus 1 family protein